MNDVLSNVLQGTDAAIAVAGAALLIWKFSQGRMSLRGAPSLPFAPRLEHVALLIWLLMATIVLANFLKPLLEPLFVNEAAVTTESSFTPTDVARQADARTDRMVPAEKQAAGEDPRVALFEALMTNLVQGVVLVFGMLLAFSARRASEPEIRAPDANAVGSLQRCPVPSVRFHRKIMDATSEASVAAIEALAICGILFFLSLLLLWYYNPEYEPGSHVILRLLRSAGDVWWGLPVLWLGAVIIAPISEEICFRGILLGWISGIAGRRLGLILSGLVFGLSHVGVQKEAVVPLVGLGLYLGFLYQKTGRLSLPIAVHALFNLKNMVWATLALGET